MDTNSATDTAKALPLHMAWDSFFSLHRRSNAGLAAATRCPVPAAYIEQMIDGSTCKDGGVFSPFRDRAHSARGRDGQTGELDRPRDGRALLPLAAHQVTGLRGHTWLMAPSLSLCCGCHASCMYATLSHHGMTKTKRENRNEGKQALLLQV